ncbi:MAG: hypothetical protein WCI27_10970, partial [Candidatus Omnitrophota bacterium]
LFMMFKANPIRNNTIKRNGYLFIFDKSRPNKKLEVVKKTAPFRIGFPVQGKCRIVGMIKSIIDEILIVIIKDFLKCKSNSPVEILSNM